MKRKILILVVLILILLSIHASAGKFKTTGDFLNEARQVVREISVDEAYKNYFKLKAKNIIFLDVREKDEVQAGHIPGAKWIPRGLLEFAINRILPYKDAQTIIVYCETGGRSLLAAKTLTDMGYKVLSMKGGFLKWSKKNYPVEIGVIKNF